MVARAAPVDAAPEAARLQLRLGLGRTVGAVGIDLLRRVGLVQEAIQLLAVVHAGITHLVASDELVLGIRVDVVLVAEKALVVLLGPARVFVFLPVLGGFLPPLGRRLAGLHRLIVLGVALPGHWN